MRRSLRAPPMSPCRPLVWVLPPLFLRHVGRIHLRILRHKLTAMTSEMPVERRAPHSLVSRFHYGSEFVLHITSPVRGRNSGARGFPKTISQPPQEAKIIGAGQPTPSHAPAAALRQARPQTKRTRGGSELPRPADSHRDGSVCHPACPAATDLPWGCGPDRPAPAPRPLLR